MTDHDDVALPKATAVGPGQGAPGGGKPYKRHLSNYLLDKKLQLRYVLTVAVLSAVISATLGYLIHRQGHMASTGVLSSFEGLDEEAYGEIREVAVEQMAESDQSLVLQMVGVGVGLVLVLSLYLVLMTHKVAGPLFKVSAYFDKMAAGRLGEVYPLRRGDMLIDFYTGFRDMHGVLRARFQEDATAMARLLAACDAAGVKRSGALGDELERLESHLAARKDALS